MLQYSVLGPFTVEIDGVDRTPQAAKVRQVLALTLARANQVVSLEALFEELWGGSPPRTAVTTAQTYIYQIRRLLARGRGEAEANRILRTVPAGYLLSAEPEQLDSWRFERAVDRARVVLEGGHTEQASAMLGEALAMWQGSALADVGHGALLQRHVTQLDEKRVNALQLRLIADMRLGRHRELIAELKSLVLTYPYHESFIAQLMVALKESGRRGEALAVFRRARQVFDDELGIGPSAQLRHIHHDILSADAPAV